MPQTLVPDIERGRILVCVFYGILLIAQTGVFPETRCRPRFPHPHLNFLLLEDRNSGREEVAKNLSTSKSSPNMLPRWTTTFGSWEAL